jgi:hypothetical protein
VAYTLGFIWAFGLTIGVVIALLCFFQIVYFSVLWPFLLPFLVRQQHIIEEPRVSRVGYGCYSTIVIIVALLAGISCFAVRYGSALQIFHRHFRTTLGLVSLAVIIIGNMTRIIVQRVVVKPSQPAP